MKLFPDWIRANTVEDVTVVAGNDLTYGSRPATKKHRPTFVVALAIILGAIPIASASAETVVAVQKHVPTDDPLGYLAPEIYASYEGSLFYIKGAKLFRLDSLEGEPIELSLPRNTLRQAIYAVITTFDGSLFFHALGRLYKISGRYSQPVLIDVPEEPNTPAFAWMDGRRGYRDGTSEFAELDGKLYFFANRARYDRVWMPDRFGTPQPVETLGQAIFRLDSASSVPRQIDWLDYALIGWPDYQLYSPKFSEKLAATDQGLLFMFDNRIYLIEKPQIIEDLNLSTPPPKHETTRSFQMLSEIK